MPKNHGQRRKTHSGAVGGPATGGGLNYQVDFAVRQALDAISRAIFNPLEQAEISMEPRVVTGHNAVTCWDVRTSPPEKVTEAKLRPKRHDILEWLDRVEAAMKQGGGGEFELFSGSSPTRLMSAVDHLCQIAKESNGDAQKFESLVELEQMAEFSSVFDHLKSEPQGALSRMRVAQLDQGALQREIEFRLRHLVHEADRERLYDLLTSRFHKAIEHRATFKVRVLIEEASQAGIDFCSPPTFEPNDIDPLVSGVIHVLQYCEIGLPVDVLASGLDCNVEEIELSLSKYVDRRVLTHDDGLWAVAPLRSQLIHDNGSVLVAKALRELLEFIRANKHNPQGWRQVPNAIALAKVCQWGAFDLVSCLFQKLDKLLKRTGNKRLVLEVANLSIAAAHRKPRTVEMTKGEAVALICGCSWVYQRINRLDEARAHGEKSLMIGRDIPWHRNTAFCLKCLGRLYRMEAERNRPDAPERHTFLNLSIDYLERAIAMFPEVTELSDADRTAEVGDCFSLLGRTYLVAGDQRKATDVSREAADRIPNQASKDYADLQILLGDLASNRGNNAAAESHYDEAIDVAGTSDAERSEIAARAYFQKGRVTGTSRHFDKAAEIWKKLEEDKNADNARWHSMRLAGRIPPSAMHLLDAETPSVRVEAVRLHEAALAGLVGSPRGQRSKTDDNYWKGRISEAKTNVTVQQPEW